MTIHNLPDGTVVALIDGDTHIGPWVIQSGRLDHDQNTLPHLTKYIPAGGTVIDVGAYIGDHTVFYARCVGDTGKVYAFEPNPRAYECLAHNCRDMRVVGINAAASDTAERIDMAQDINAGASHAIPGEAIACITIDSLNLAACHFIKMDCEGMEPKAIKGAAKTISTHRPAMLIEVNHTALQRQGYTSDSIFDLLDAMGYAYTNLHEREGMTGEQFDILCKPKP
jgi:FkbM family methyltransferase